MTFWVCMVKVVVYFVHVQYVLRQFIYFFFLTFYYRILTTFSIKNVAQSWARYLYSPRKRIHSAGLSRYVRITQRMFVHFMKRHTLFKSTKYLHILMQLLLFAIFLNIFDTLDLIWKGLTLLYRAELILKIIFRWLIVSFGLRTLTSISESLYLSKHLYYKTVLIFYTNSDKHFRETLRASLMFETQNSK